MYKAVGSRGSRVSRVLWMLEELGQPYAFVEVKLRSPEATRSTLQARCRS